MAYWTGQDLPFYHGLARTFPLADRWFSSCLGPTFPNRRFLMAGTANGLMDDLPWDLVDCPAAGTILDMLTTARDLLGQLPQRAARPRLLLKRLLGTRGLIAAGGSPSSAGWLPPVVQRGQAGSSQFTADLYPLGMAGYMRHLRTASSGSSPMPTRASCRRSASSTRTSASFSEENPQDIRKGESFAAEVITRVMHGTGWADTLLIWTYDENGGYYDHVPRPRRCRRTTFPAQTGRSALAAGCAALLKVLFPAMCGTELEIADAGPEDLRQLRVPGARGDRVPYARPGLRVSDGLRPHLGAEAHRGEVEPARADPAGRRGCTPAGRTGPGRPAGVPEAAGLPAPSLAWGSW